MDYGLTPELNKIIDYLSNVFSRSIDSSIYQKEDLAQDLVVLYLEQLQDKKHIKSIKEPDNYWFKIFKNHLISKYRSVISEKKLLAKIENEEVFYRNTATDTKILDL